jgi:hypothetical protein
MLGNPRGPGIRIDQLIELAEETARLRLTQMHAWQARAARIATDQLLMPRRDRALGPQPPTREQTATEVRRVTWNRAALIAAQEKPNTYPLSPPIPVDPPAKPEVCPALPRRQSPRRGR